MPISDLARSLSRPILAADDLESMEQFFQRPEVGAFLTHARNPAHTAAALQECADLLPQLHPSHAAALALMGGSLVESGADPAILFPTLHALLRDWLPDSGHALRDAELYYHYLDDPEEVPEAILRADICVPVA